MGEEEGTRCESGAVPAAVSPKGRIAVLGHWSRELGRRGNSGRARKPAATGEKMGELPQGHGVCSVAVRRAFCPSAVARLTSQAARCGCLS